MTLSKEQINSIETKALDALSSAYDGASVEDIYPPIDLVKVAQQFGLTIKSGQFVDESISGAYQRAEKTIYVSEGETPQRKLFTIAHELGHHVLHENKKDHEVFYRSNLLNLDKEKREEETEANWFAASLLMPRSLFVKVWQAYGDVEKVADLFRVSPTAVYFRLKNLQLID